MTSIGGRLSAHINWISRRSNSRLLLLALVPHAASEMPTLYTTTLGLPSSVDDEAGAPVDRDVAGPAGAGVAGGGGCGGIAGNNRDEAGPPGGGRDNCASPKLQTRSHARTHARMHACTHARRLVSVIGNTRQ